MTMKEFARILNGREYDCCMFTKQEIQQAKDKGWVIITGASDDLMEFDGAMDDEGGCFDPKRLSGMAKMINQFSRTALKLSGVARKL